MGRASPVIGIPRILAWMGSFAHLPEGTCRRNMQCMSAETVVTLPDDVRAILDQRAPNPPERSELVAAALRAYFAWPRPGEDAGDLAVINAHAEELNAEAEDALAYQVPL